MLEIFLLGTHCSMIYSEAARAKQCAAYGWSAANKYQPGAAGGSMPRLVMIARICWQCSLAWLLIRATLRTFCTVCAPLLDQRQCKRQHVWNYGDERQRGMPVPSLVVPVPIEQIDG